MYVCLYVCVSLCVCMYICVCAFVCSYACMYVCVYVCMYVCTKYAYTNRSSSNYSHTCMHQVRITYASSNRRSFKYAHTCMHQVCIYQSQLLQVCTHMYASSMHLSIAVLASMDIHVCIKHAYINRSSFKHAHTCMHQVCITYASCMHHVCHQSRYPKRLLIYQTAPNQTHIERA